MQQFEEVKQHKPSVIYIPNVDIWYRTLGESAIRTFTGLLRSLPPTEPILLLGILEKSLEEDDEETRKFNATLESKMLRDLFGYSKQNQFEIPRPDEPARLEYFDAMIEYIRKAPSEFPQLENRKRRKLPELPVAPAEEETPEGPSKTDEKAQKKKDRQTLNMLKLHIQGVMDQIKLKYRKFRTPVIEDRDIAYLYDEQNPEMLTTDLTEEQRQQAQLFRPYEIDKDDKGFPGLREVVSGKFYYNLEIVTIEKRLSNGYYKRPRDFLADIKRLAKDARTLGDQDRTFRANEMLANVEVDMATLETQQPTLVAECEAVYEREQERERKRLAKTREAERQGENVPKVVPNVPPPNASKTTTETSGPVELGQAVPGGRPPLLPVTPSRMQGPSLMSNRWSTTNESHTSHHTNGATVPSRPREDTEMTNTPAEPHERGCQHPSAASPSQPNTQGEYSQKSAHTRVAQGSQVEQYHNSASTTTSGQKTSDNRSSGPFSINTQLSNGVRPGDHPDFSMLPEARGGSQLPDTQEQLYESSQSQPGSQASQPMAPPPRQASITSILNTNNPNNNNTNNSATANHPSPADTAAETEAHNPEQPADKSASVSRTILDTQNLSYFLTELVHRSSGLSVEQLEQVTASMMDVIWAGRGDWNRNRVLWAVKEAFNRTVRDIEACQVVLGPSQASE